VIINENGCGIKRETAKSNPRTTGIPIAMLFTRLISHHFLIRPIFRKNEDYQRIS